MTLKIHLEKLDKTTVLEYGHIYFFYRPKVQDEAAQEPVIKSDADVQRFYVVTHPVEKQCYRLLIIGHKKLPEAEEYHEKNWALVDKVTTNSVEIRDYMREKRYLTKTRGERFQPAARCCGQGVYCLAAHGRNTYLTYMLESPGRCGDVQKALRIKPEACYVLSVKNPELPGMRAGNLVHFPKSLAQLFKGRRFIALNPPNFLNYENVELIFVGASLDVSQVVDIKMETEKESFRTSDIFSNLKSWRQKNPIAAL